MLDGKGLVYQKRAGTGSAVYSTPDFRIGANPLDVIANQIKTEGKYKVAAEAQKKAANLKALEVDLTGWDYDNKRYFADMENQLKREGAALATAGKDLNNFADKDVADWHQKADKWVKAAKASANQGEMYKSLVDLAAKDPDKYDLEATMSGAKQYMEMTPDQRLQADPQTLLVFRYDPYGPIDKLNVDDFGGTVAWKGLTSFSERESLDAKKLRNEINSRAENPENLKFYEYNKNKYGWKDLNDYKDFLYTYKKNQFVADSKAGLLDSGSSAKAGWGPEQYLDNASRSGNIEVDTAVPFSEGATSETRTQKMSIFNAQGIGGLNIVVPGTEALILKTNKKGTGAVGMQGNYEIANANIGVALIRKDNGQLLDAGGGKFKFRNKDGKDVIYSPKEAFQAGLVEYVPVIQGNGKYTTDDDKAKYEPIVVEADKFITPDFTQKSANENDAYQKYLAAKQLAYKYNEAEKTGLNTVTNPEEKQSQYRKTYQY